MNTVMSACVNLTKMAGGLAKREGFATWSKLYDSQVNPLLALEERFTAELLPDVRGLDVVDVGCGTGRWLVRLADKGASSLTGIDFSPEMVDRAKRKLGDCATILVGDAASLPLPSRSADVLLASFVASYVDDLSQFAAEIRRVARMEARIHLSDLHPATASACNWKRGFRAAGTEIELPTYARSVHEVISCFEALGFETVLLLEPSFGSPEREILQNAGKMPAFDAAAGRPAIYILRLKLVQRAHQPAITRSAKPEIKLTCARIALGPSESAFADPVLENGQISSIWAGGSSRVRAQYAHALDLDGYLLLPGLTNSHDHLEFGLFPNLGHGPYTNFEQWAREIHQTDSDLIERQREIPKDVRLWWGAIRNLLCGVTTVCHHNPLDPVLLGDGFVVRALTNFGWAHSVAMDPDLRARFQATPKHVPFVLHAAEGLDENSADEIFALDRIQALDDRTVLVHGLGLTSNGISLLNRRGAALVWCPTSNRFLFGQTRSWESLATVNNLVLGSDSPLTAAGDLLDEIRYAHVSAGVEPEELYRLAITRPPDVFRLDDGRGAIRPGSAADLIAVRDSGASPANTLAQMSSNDVEMVVVAGRLQLASEVVFGRLPNELTAGLQPLEVDGQIRWVRAPLPRLFGKATEVLGRDITLGKKRVRHVCTEWI